MTEGADGTLLPLVAVAVGKETKSSQSALKWALENVTTKSQTLFLVYVNTKHSAGHYEDQEVVAREVLVPYRCFCKRKSVVCKDIILEDTDVAKAIVDFVANSAIEKLVVGGSKGGFVRSFRSTDIGTAISKNVPDFCTVYIISKGKVSSVRNALRSAPTASILRSQIPKNPKPVPALNQPFFYGTNGDAAGHTLNQVREREIIKSPFNRRPREESLSFTDISFVSSGRPSVDRVIPPRTSYSSDLDSCFEPIRSPNRTYDLDSGVSCYSNESLPSEDMKAEMDRLRLELKQTMDMYNTACREALSAKQKAMEYNRWKKEEQQRLAEEAASAPVDKERAKSKAAEEAAEATNRVAEMKELQESKRENASNNLLNSDMRYRRYTIEEIETAADNFAENRKIGEGGYGPVYKCHLDHTPVAVKVLRPDAAQGKAQFQQEVEILSCIRHPHMVILVGACPEYGCLVYEYMARGSLEDCLLRRGNAPPIPWQHRFRIAAEIGTALLFLHQTKPEPLVHRDLKPANILLDQNYVSKIGDVGLARLIPSVVDSVTQYHMTSAAGTFYYIDPEYQKTGMLGVKSDIYSFGVLLLQLITGRPPMALAHQVESSIEKDAFAEVLDPSIQDWPVEEALCLAKLALRCAELRRKDRPDLGAVVLPELNRLRDIGEENIQPFMFLKNYRTPPIIHNQVYVQEVDSEPLQAGFDSASQYSGPTIVGR